MPNKAGIGSHTRPNAGAKDEWLTPPLILAALGDFDLDPCAAPEPRPWPTATHHVTLPDDGLAIEWEGRVWLNPPYGRQTWTWLNRLGDHGDGIALTFARTETTGFVESLWERADALLFLAGRLFFHHANGERAQHNSGGPSVLAAFGDRNVDALATCGLEGFLTINWLAPHDRKQPRRGWGHPRHPTDDRAVTVPQAGRPDKKGEHMPKMYNPDTQETVDAAGPEVRERKEAGFVTVGNRPTEEYEGKSREELLADDDDDEAEAPEA